MLSEHRAFKNEYGRNLRVAIAATLLAVLVTFVAFPPAAPPAPPTPPTAPAFVLEYEVFRVPRRRDPVRRPVVPISRFDEIVREVVRPDALAENSEVSLYLPTPSPDDEALLEFDDPPLAIHMVRPNYPEAARRAGIEGLVILRVHVGAKGKVRTVRVLRSDPYIFGNPTREAILRWRFSPAQRNGQPVASAILLPISFVLI